MSHHLLVAMREIFGLVNQIYICSIRYIISKRKQEKPWFTVSQVNKDNKKAPKTYENNTL